MRSAARTGAGKEAGIAEAWSAQLAQAARTPWVLQSLMGQDAGVAARFAYYHARLRSLPRRVRRLLGRRRCLGLAG